MQEESARKQSIINKLLYNSTWRGWLFQAMVLGGLLLFVFWIISNTLTNLQRLGKKSGFDFLDQRAGFEILSSPGVSIMNYEPGVSTYMDIFWVGTINTITVALLGIIAATLLGFVLGIMRLSKNKIFSAIATVYVEIFRNVPLLLQLFFWYFFALRAVPDLRERLSLFGGLGGINKAGLFLPAPIFETGFGYVALAFLAGLVGCWLYGKRATAVQFATGHRPKTLPVYLALLIGLPLAVFIFMGNPLHWELPVFSDTGSILKRGYAQDVGLVIKPEFIGVWLALSLYTASFIAEIVRSGIMAVSHGQTEASQALGLQPGLIQRLIVIPQAMRVIVPPLTSQFLNLTKNSSLAVAIAYPDIVSVFAGTSLNQIGQEIEMIFMMMMLYLFLSLTMSLFMNWFNSRIKLVER